jgi:very-short-patch-repair endonuclease
MEIQRPFIGSEAVASGELTRHELRRYYRAVAPNVYLDKRIDASLKQRTHAAWLWSGREAVVAGLAAASLHGAKWIDDDVPVELIWRNARAPRGVVTRADLLLDGEARAIGAGILVTTPARTAFDIGRRGRLDEAVARLDALAAAGRIACAEIRDVADAHPRARGLPQLRAALDLVDAGAESPRETWLRLLLIRASHPRPRTQIPVVSPDGLRRYYLDMGWEDVRVAVEYDGDHHRSDPVQFGSDVRRLADVDELGWRLIRVVKRSHPDEVLARVQRAWDACSALR